MRNSNTSYKFSFSAAQNKTMLAGFSVLGVLLFNAACRADVSLNGLFSDHMVLQRERPVPVWG
jgi:hypothetical protein